MRWLSTTRMRILSTLFQFARRHVVVIVILFVVASMVNTTLRILKRGDAVEEAKAKLAQVEAEKKRLAEELSRVNSAEFIEEQARDKLGLAKEGETVVVLPPDEVLRSLAPATEEDELFLEILPIWRRWVKLFLPELEKTLPRG